MINCLSQLESYRSKDVVGVTCSRCSVIIKTRVSSLRYYFKHKSDKYVCHNCKVKENGPLIGEKIRANARKKGFVISDYKDEKCVICGVVVKARIRNINCNKRRNSGEFHCVSCSLKVAHKSGKFASVYTPSFKEKLWSESEKFWIENRGTWKSRIVTEKFRSDMSVYGKRAWVIDEYRNKMLITRSTAEFREKLSMWSKMAWSDQFRERFNKLMCGHWKNVDFRKNITDKAVVNSNLLWSNPEYKEKTLDAIRKLWEDDNYKLKMADVRLSQPRTSTQQKILYSILNDLKVKYLDDQSHECKVGYYTFDCRINPQSGVILKNPLLIEVNGDYWHNIPSTVAKDKSKSTYLKTYFPEFDLKYLWEHEFNNKDRVVSLLKYWLGVGNNDLVSFSFSDVQERVIEASEAELFISKYHYAGRIGRSGLNIGYFVGDELVAVIIFVSPVRQESALRLNVPYGQVLELSRLAIHPQYQVKNFASHLIGRSIRLVRLSRPDVRMLISFADSTHNHQGVIYKASNWRLDGEVPPDYWYADNRGYICHKKTLWNHAKKMSMTESVYCEKFGYVKVWGKGKFRYVFDLCV